MKARGPERPKLSEDEEALLRAQQSFLQAQDGAGSDPSAPAAVARRGAPPPLLSAKNGKGQNAPPAEALGPQRSEVDGVWLT